MFHRRKRPYAALQPNKAPKHFLVPNYVRVPVDRDKDGKRVPAQQAAKGAKPGLQGVPECINKHGLMTFWKTNGAELTPNDRIKRINAADAAQAKLDRAGELGLSDAEIDELRALTKVVFPLPAGQEEGHNCQLRFICKHCDFTENSYVRWDPRIYSKYPRAGSGRWVNRRLAYINVRSSIESFHAESIWHGTAGRRGERMLKDTDEKVAWLDGLALLAMTREPLVLLDGSYDWMARRVVRFGIGLGNRKDGRDVLPPREFDEQLRFDTRRELWERAEAPETWVADPDRREDARLEQVYSAESKVFSLDEARRAREARLAKDAQERAAGAEGGKNAQVA